MSSAAVIRDERLELRRFGPEDVSPAYLAAMRWLAAGVAFGSLGLHKLTAGVIADNIASEKAFRKAGFTIEGVRRKQNLCAGEWRDLTLLGLLKADWEALRA